MPSFVRDWMIFSRSSTAIWWVSRSASLDREVSIRCFNSTIAKWDESEDEEEAEDDLDGAVWFGGFEGFVDLWALIFDSCTGIWRVDN